MDDRLWDRLVSRIVRDEKVEPDYAARIMDQALGFLMLCAKTGKSYSPSAAVDLGWHTFILYTQDYLEFCNRLAGHFIHHAPMDEEGMDYGIPLDTVAAMKQLRIAVDDELWLLGADGGSTHRCHGDDCTNAGGGKLVAELVTTGR
ncbi:MAG TPA: hypothetical protein VHV74_01050 [Pseudonocardiaceae bacterium]|nr:hypothetical protein [Pseudonocardiaceae bacterium]